MKEAIYLRQRMEDSTIFELKDALMLAKLSFNWYKCINNLCVIPGLQLLSPFFSSCSQRTQDCCSRVNVIVEFKDRTFFFQLSKKRRLPQKSMSRLNEKR